MKSLFRLASVLVFATSTGAAMAAPLQLKSAAPVSHEGEICIVEHANICPPEPLDIVFPCITTGMLAGQTCPETGTKHDDDGVVGLGQMAQFQLAR